MSTTTKRWMQAELDQLLAQRQQYEMASKTAATPHQRRRRTQRLRALDEEILGRNEALSALAEHDDAPPRIPVRRRPEPGTRARPTAAFRALAAQRAPKIGNGLDVMTTKSSPWAGELTRVVGSAFMVGFIATAAAMWAAGVGQTPTDLGRARAQHREIAPAAKTHAASPVVDDAVLAAPGPARR